MLSVPIVEGSDLSSQEVKEHSSCAEQQAESQKNIELQDCFNLYLAEKTLSEDNVR